MSIRTSIFKIFRKEHSHASRIQHPHDDGQPDNSCRLHPFASRCERTISDLRRIRMLAETVASQSGGTSDCSSDDPIRKLIAVAKANGLYATIPSAGSLTADSATFSGELISKRTGESEVYFNASEHAYYKVKWPSAKSHIKQTSENDWLFEHIIHNILFPNTAYDFIGITIEVGELKIVLRQQEVQSEDFPTDEQIADHLQNILGLVAEDRYFFGNEVLAVTDVGSQSDNVLLGDDSRLYFIDPLIRLKKPALEVIEHLTGATLTCA